MQRKLKNYYHIIALLFILALSFGLNFYAISQNGTGNEYYAAAVKSMTQSFHNFFFVSFDPSGMVTVDKPPLGLWVQAIFVLVFGYHGWVLLLPQALAGTASCLMLYLLTSRYFGKAAGLISSLIFAITPVVVVASRNNTMDMQLIFVLLLASWFLFKSIDTGKWRFLFLAALAVGLGFNIKMLQAYMILPAVAVVYLIFAKEKFSRRLLAGFLSMAIVAVVSLAWVVAVDLVPASSRPYVDSTSGNSMMELIFGHNGTERLFGQSVGGGGGGGSIQNQDDGNGGAKFDGNRESTDDTQQNGTESGQDTASATDNTTQNPGGTNQNGTPPQMQSGNDDGGYGTPPQMQNGDGENGGGQTSFGGNRSNNMGGGTVNGSEIGTASPVRLWSSNLYGQGSWLLLFAIASIFVCFSKSAFRKKEGGQASLLYWALWLATMVIFFSFAGFYHRYYLSMLAPAVAVLSGIGIVAMFRGFRHKAENKKEYIRPALLLLSLIADIALEISFVLGYEWKVWLVPVIAGFGLLGLLLLGAYFFTKKRLALVISTAALLVSVLAAPFCWALTPVMYVPNATLPYAGPELAGTGGGQTFQGTSSKTSETTSSSGLEQYLVKNYKEGSFLVVSQRSSDVAQFIIDTGLPCYAYGGFLGSDNSLTLDKLKEYVSEGKITYFLVSSEGGSGNSDIISYVEENATKVDASEYGGSSTSGGQTGGTLYVFQ